MTMATFEDVEKHITQRAALNQMMLELRTELTRVRNAVAENDTWLRANSSMVKGWKLHRGEAQKPTGERQ